MPLPSQMCTHDLPLSDEDLQLLRRNRRGRPFQALFGTYLFLTFLGAGVLFLVLSFDSGSYSKAGLLLPLMSAIFLGLAAFVGLRLAPMPRSWLLINRALAGDIPKQIVTGRLQSIQPGTKPGIHYVLDTQQVDVALPHWNEIMVDTDSGVQPRTVQAMVGGSVTLHLLPLLPGRQPLLLRADYHDSPAPRSTTERLTEEDRETVQKTVSFLRMFMWSLAALFVAAAFFLPPLFLVSVILALVSFIPEPKSRAVKQATCKRIVSGVVDEVLTFRILEGSVGTQHTSVSAKTLYNYRIGGLLYQVPGENIHAEPGQQVTLEFLDRGDQGLVPLFFRIEDGPRIEL